MLVDFETSNTRYSLFQEGRGKVICCLVWGQLSLLIIKFDDKLGKKKKKGKNEAVLQESVASPSVSFLVCTF